MSVSHRSRLLSAVALAAVMTGSGSLAGPVTAASSVRFQPGPWIELAGALGDFMPVLRDVSQAVVGPSNISYGSDGRLTVLLVGSDHRPASGTGERLDTIMVMSIKASTGKVSAMSFPRDTGYIPLPGGGTYNGKINGLFKYFKKQSGGSRTVALVKFEQTIEGILRVPIDYHAFMRFDGFDALVDVIGGVPTRIPQDILDTGYIDKPMWPKGAKFLADTIYPYPVLRGASAQRCYGPYPKGAWHTAPNCFRALVYVRSRKGRVGSSANNDWRRSARQQDFIMATIDALNSGDLSGLRSKALSMPNDVYTNMPTSAGDLSQLYNLLKGSSLTQRAVLQPSFYATRVKGTSKYKLNLTNVRNAAKSFFD